MNHHRSACTLDRRPGPIRLMIEPMYGVLLLEADLNLEGNRRGRVHGTEDQVHGTICDHSACHFEPAT